MRIFSFSKIINFFILLVSGLFLSATPLFAASRDLGLNTAAKAVGSALPTQSSLPLILGNAIGTVLSFIGIIFFAILVFAGLKWMFAMGNEEQAKKALEIVFAAIIGLLIILASYAITQSVFHMIKNGNLTSSPVAPTTQCSIDYGTKGLSCNKVTSCDSTSLQDIHKEGKGKLAGADNNYIQNLCPGGNSIVCCKPKIVIPVACLEVSNGALKCVQLTGTSNKCPVNSTSYSMTKCNDILDAGKTCSGSLLTGFVKCVATEKESMSDCVKENC